MGRSIGFVPTMGALHDGHISLIRKSCPQNDLTVCSIFVNPTQFNNNQDFRLYPVRVERDIDQLVNSGCDILFLPAANEIYPPGYTRRSYPIGELENILEGAHRPGHFQGVCEVVDRLLQIVKPRNFYLGQKDFQQCMVISRLLEILDKELEINLEIIPTMREKDGLAMSSRNLRLNAEDRKKATAIYRTLDHIRNKFPSTDVHTLEKDAVSALEKAGFVVDYVSIRSRDNLTKIAKPGEPAVALVAATISEIRLIDNMILG